jgi:hypothetical protein
MCCQTKLVGWTFLSDRVLQCIDSISAERWRLFLFSFVFSLKRNGASRPVFSGNQNSITGQLALFR